MIRINEELMTYFRNYPALVGGGSFAQLIDPDDIVNHYAEKYKNYPTMIFDVKPYEEGTPVITERLDLLEVVIVGRSDDVTFAVDKISRVVRETMRGMMGRTITFHSSSNAWLNGRDKCVVIRCTEKESPMYMNDVKEGLVLYKHLFEIKWQDRSL